jgi:hypothetical protein
MKLPAIDQPQRLKGLYVFDFGEWTAVGYTVEEIALLVESDAHRNGHVYKIVRARPDGSFELRGVSRERFELESGILFYRSVLNGARRDFDDLCAAAARLPPPCRALLQVADRVTSNGGARFVTALIYPAEYEDEVGQWLDAIGFHGGDRAEGGISHVTNYNAEGQKRILEHRQLCGQPVISSRSADEVLASVRLAIQR